MSSTVAVQLRSRAVKLLFDRSPSAESGDRAETVRSTIAALGLFDPDGTSQAEDGLRYPFAILPTDHDEHTIPLSIREYLKQLTQSANATATSLACGSILAGHASEADEFGDVAFWLGHGDYGSGHELDLLKSLNLESAVPADCRIQELDVSPMTGLPATVNVSSSTDADLLQLRELLHRLSTVRVFCLHGEYSLYILLGHYDAEGHSGWAGLLGLGVQS
ncbi:hypothetical protein BD414DRAFT_541044 [Trametes punicea]|nr:hypothetical protein BD414DRAFT_541044 [Trametes punicea]